MCRAQGSSLLPTYALAPLRSLPGAIFAYQAEKGWPSKPRRTRATCPGERGLMRRRDGQLLRAAYLDSGGSREAQDVGLARIYLLSWGTSLG